MHNNALRSVWLKMMQVFHERVWKNCRLFHCLDLPWAKHKCRSTITFCHIRWTVGWIAEHLAEWIQSCSWKSAGKHKSFPFIGWHLSSCCKPNLASNSPNRTSLPNCIRLGPCYLFFVVVPGDVNPAPSLQTQFEALLEDPKFQVSIENAIMIRICCILGRWVDLQQPFRIFL